MNWWYVNLSYNNFNNIVNRKSIHCIQYEFNLLVSLDFSEFSIKQNVTNGNNIYQYKLASLFYFKLFQMSLLICTYNTLIKSTLFSHNFKFAPNTKLLKPMILQTRMIRFVFLKYIHYIQTFKFVSSNRFIGSHISIKFWLALAYCFSLPFN